MNFFYYIINLCCNKFDHNEEKKSEIFTNLDYSGELESRDTSSGKKITISCSDELSSSLSQIDEVSEYSSNSGVSNINNSYYSLDQSLICSPQAYVLAEKNLNLKANIKRFRH
jgi:hypothetical protein